MTYTEAQVEAAAKAMWESDDSRPWREAKGRVRDQYLADARTALAAADAAREDRPCVNDEQAWRSDPWTRRADAVQEEDRYSRASRAVTEAKARVAELEAALVAEMIKTRTRTEMIEDFGPDYEKHLR